LIELSEFDRVKPLTTTTVLREAKRRILGQLEAAKAPINRLRKDARILFAVENSPLAAVSHKLDIESLADEIHKNIEDVLHLVGCVQLTHEAISIDHLLTAYFTSQPPFGAGEKRKEFPDAINVQTLEMWAEIQNAKVYVISGDKDLELSCINSKRLIHLASLDEFFNLENLDYEAIDWIESVLPKRMDLIEIAIAKVFADSYYALDDEDGDSDSATVQDVTIHEVNIVSVEEDQIEVQVDCTVRVLVAFQYDDPNMTLWDEGEKHSFKTIETTLDREINESVSVTLTVDRKTRDILSAESNQFELRLLTVHRYDDNK